jgi:hypothetical protein
VSHTETDDVAEEEAWCAHQRDVAIEYMSLQATTFGALGEWPAWHLAPYVSVWAVESIAAPGRVGWWVICGDLPTDYTSGADTPDPRAAMIRFATRWCELAASMERGEQPSGFTVGTPKNADELAPLLKARARILTQWANDDTVWAA